MEPLSVNPQGTSGTDADASELNMGWTWVEALNLSIFVGGLEIKSRYKLGLEPRTN